MNHEECIKELNKFNAQLEALKEQHKLWEADSRKRREEMNHAVDTLFKTGGFDFIDVAMEALEAETPQEVKGIFERYKSKIVGESNENTPDQPN